MVPQSQQSMVPQSAQSATYTKPTQQFQQPTQQFQQPAQYAQSQGQLAGAQNSPISSQMIESQRIGTVLGSRPDVRTGQLAQQQPITAQQQPITGLEQRAIPGTVHSASVVSPVASMADPYVQQRQLEELQRQGTLSQSAQFTQPQLQQVPQQQFAQPQFQQLPQQQVSKGVQQFQSPLGASSQWSISTAPSVGPYAAELTAQSVPFQSRMIGQLGQVPPQFEQQYLQGARQFGAEPSVVPQQFGAEPSVVPQQFAIPQEQFGQAASIPVESQFKSTATVPVNPQQSVLSPIQTLPSIQDPIQQQRLAEQQRLEQQWIAGQQPVQTQSASLSKPQSTLSAGSVGYLAGSSGSEHGRSGTDYGQGIEQGIVPSQSELPLAGAM
jgi:hypothetical protein